jgi:hypothetical protein
MDRQRARFEMRASYLKEVLAAVERRGPPTLQRLLEVAEPGHALAAIQAAARSDWLPAHVGFAMPRALERAVGMAQTRAIYQDACLASFQAGALGPIFSSAVRIFGPSPHLIARFFPSGWSAIWRGCGEIVVEEARPGLIRLAHARLPREAAFDAFVEASAACFESVLVACRRRGRGAVERRGGEPIGYVLSWEEG